jgi:hypothetical protein
VRLPLIASRLGRAFVLASLFGAGRTVFVRLVVGACAECALREGSIYFGIAVLAVPFTENLWRRQWRQIKAVDDLRKILGRRGISRRRAFLLAAGAAIVIPSLAWGILASLIRGGPWWAVIGFLSHALYIFILIGAVLLLYPSSRFLLRRDGN